MWPKLYAKADGNASLVFPGRRRGARARRGLGRAAATACRAPQEIVAGGRRGALVRLLGRARGLTLRIGRGNGRGNSLAQDSHPLAVSDVAPRGLSVGCHTISCCERYAAEAAALEARVASALGAAKSDPSNVELVGETLGEA